jgi:serine/threonine protein kinase
MASPGETTGLLAGRYRVGKVIGRGGMSTVFTAQDMQVLGRDGAPREVALKVMRIDAAAPDLARLLQLEARRLIDISHPNIVRVHNSHAHGPFQIMVMERLHGVTLADVVRSRDFAGLPLPLAYSLTREIGAGLHHAHGRGLVHADLKPGNVFIASEGRAKLLDFGTAQGLADPERRLGEDDSELAVERVGALTPAYASPERLRGAPPGEVDDVFSLGVITYIVMTGRHPFDRKTALKARDELMEPRRIGSLSRRRWAAMRAALSFDPADRPQSVAEFVAGVASDGILDAWFG